MATFYTSILIVILCCAMHRIAYSSIWLFNGDNNDDDGDDYDDQICEYEDEARFINI